MFFLRFLLRGHRTQVLGRMLDGKNFLHLGRFINTVGVKEKNAINSLVFILSVLVLERISIWEKLSYQGRKNIQGK